MSLSPVAISLGAFGADFVRQQGQDTFVPLLVAADVTRIELREELFTTEDFASLAASIRDHGLECLYSAPLELWLEGKAQPNPALDTALQNATACGAGLLKVSLGHFSGNHEPEGREPQDSDVAALADVLARYDVHLLVENDQTMQGGRIEPFTQFFAQVESLQMPIGMTFDIGNWLWQEQSAISAATKLGRYVEYLHCKAVMRNAAGKLVAIPPAQTDLHLWEQLLRHMPEGIPRAVEYPLQGDDLLQVTREHVATLARLGQSNPHLSNDHQRRETLSHV